MHSPPAAAAALVLALVAGCGGATPRHAPSPPPPPPPPFSGGPAMEHVRALSALGPRPTGSEGVAAAADYVRGRLEALGIETTPLPSQLVVDTEDDLPAHLADLEPGAEIPTVGVLGAIAGTVGREADVILLATHLDTAPEEAFPLVGANESASGAAVLLELARVLREEPLPYVVWLAFVDGDLLEEDQRLGSLSLGTWLRSTGENERVRAAVTLQQVCDADLGIARDPDSSRRLRGALFAAAERLGHAEAFGVEYQEGLGGHRALARMGIDRVAALSDPVYGGDEAPGVYWRTEEDTPERCSAESLEIVGDVVLAGVREVAVRSARIDRLAAADAAAGTTAAEDAEDAEAAPRTLLPAPLPDPEAEETAAAESAAADASGAGAEAVPADAGDGW